MDQIPLPFISRMVKRALGRRRDSAGNYMPAWEKLPTEDSLDKRQATLMPTIRPTGTQPVPCLLILRGTGGQLDSGEIEAYRQAKENGVRVLFQPKAWADTWIMMRWLLHIFIPSVRSAGIVGCVMLGLDNHGAQCHPSFKAACEAHEIFLVYTPEYTTDVTAPVDHHVGAHMKKLMQDSWDKELVMHFKYWTEGDDEMFGRNAAYRRILMSRWCVQSWRMTQLERLLLLHSFTSTGFLCKMDRSDIHLIKIALDGCLRSV